MWATNGIVVNPAANAILADTGAMSEDMSHDYDIYLSSTVATAMVVEWRNATDTANVFSHILPIAANTTFVFTSRGSLMMLTGQRIRVRQNAAATGSVQASINFF
jgi:hypothetical protein